MATANSNKSVVVVGVGYVGLPFALLLAKAGHKVLGVDVNESIVRALRSGEVHIPEPGLAELMKEPGVRERISGSLTPEPADVFVIAVPTPLQAPRQIAELTMVEAAARSIAPHVKAGNLVILESTVPPGTCRQVVTPILESVTGLKVGKDILLAHCPERVLPGNAIHEIVNNDRIIGGIDAASTEAAASLYATFVKGTLVKTDDMTAEMCKLMENTFRDVNIALANELAQVCETLGIDVNAAISIANRHPRVNILHPGIGVGGHCIPIDPWFIAEVDPRSCRLIPAARRINDERPHVVAGLIRREVKDVADPRIVCLGATYKADTYDLRESPALEIVHLLRADGYTVDLVDPITKEHGERSLAEALRGADLAVVLVPHAVLKSELEKNGDALKGVMRRGRIVDVSLGAVRAL